MEQVRRMELAILCCIYHLQTEPLTDGSDFHSDVEMDFGRSVGKIQPGYVHARNHQLFDDLFRRARWA